VRAPDIAFVAAAPAHAGAAGFAEARPTWWSVLSPGDRPGETLAKVGTGWRRALGWWVIGPSATGASTGATAAVARVAADALDGEDIVPGFACRLEEII
jgi:hypothetical protein